VSKGLSNATIQDVARLAREMGGMIQSRMPDQIAGVGISAGAPKKRPDGGYEVELRFNRDNLRRRSLYPKGYPRGVRNIVALFNIGYEAEDFVYGVWVHHSSSTVLPDSIDGFGGVIQSRMSRDGLWFMQAAVREFVDRYGTQYDVRAVLSSVYEESDDDDF
jgi:hypothetical protein